MSWDNRRNLSVFLVYFGAVPILWLAEKLHAGAVMTQFWKPAFREQCQPQIDKYKAANEVLTTAISQIGDFAHEAIVEPDSLSDRQALAMILEIARGLE